MIKKSQIGAIFACGLAILLYGKSLHFDFTYDDRGVVLQNEAISELDWWQMSWGSYWGESGDGLYRPLAVLSYGLNIAYSQEPAVFHGTNIALHGINVLLLYLLVCRLAGGARACGAALLFASQPVLVESVASVVGRAELLSFTFGLCGWIFWSLARGGRADAIYWLVAGIALFFSQLAKENGIVFALAILSCEIRKGALGERVDFYRYLIPIGACVCGGVLKYWAIGDIRPRVIGFIDNPLAYADLTERVANGLAIYLRYILKVIYPWPLSIDYSYNQLPIAHWFTPDTLLVLCLLSSGVYWLLRWSFAYELRWIWSSAVGVSIFIVSSIPVASSTIFAERLLYMPTAGFSFLLSSLIWGLRTKTKYVLLFLVGFIFSLLTIVRLPVWQSDSTLFNSAVISSPHSARSYYGLGLVLHRNRDWEDALVAYERALAIYPRYADAQYNRAALLLGIGKLTEAQSAYAQVLVINPNYKKATYALALIEIELGKVESGLEKLRVLARGGGREAGIAFESLVQVLIELGRKEEADLMLSEWEQ